MRVLAFFTALILLSCNEKAKESETSSSKEKSEIAIIKEFMPKLNGIWYSGNTVEHWKQLNDSCFQAHVYDFETLDTLEKIDVYPMKGAYIFAPTVYGQNDDDPIFFEFKSLEGNEIVFTNPSHDWPKEISYRKADGDSLYAVVSGTDEGEYKEFKLNFIKLEFEIDTTEGIVYLKKNIAQEYLSILDTASTKTLYKWIKKNKFKFPLISIMSKNDVYAMSYNLAYIHMISTLEGHKNQVDQSDTDDYLDLFNSVRENINFDTISRLFDIQYPATEILAKGAKRGAGNAYSAIFIKKDTSFVSYFSLGYQSPTFGKALIKNDTLYIDNDSYLETDSSFNCINCVRRTYLLKPTPQ